MLYHITDTSGSKYSNKSTRASEQQKSESRGQRREMRGQRTEKRENLTSHLSSLFTIRHLPFLLLTSCFLFFTSFSFADENSFDHLINRYAMEYGLDPALIKAVIKVESNFNKFSVSPKGAMGLMQLMPETAAIYSVKNIYCPKENIMTGTRHLRNLLILYHGDIAKALAAYNAGAGKVKKYNGIPPYRETKDYIDKVIRYKKNYGSKGKLFYYTDDNGCVVFYNR